MSAFFEHAVEGIFRTTPEGRYVSVNPALAHIYGYSTPEELISALTDIAGQLYVDPGRREAFGALLQSHDVVTDFVSEIRRRDGKHIWISENARAVRDWTGRLVFYEGTVMDVTAKIESERALRKALCEAERANEMKAAFLAAMSHELKTPLNAILGFAEILKLEMFGPLGHGSYADYIGHIHDSGTHLLQIINNVLDITRLTASAVTLQREPIQLCTLVKSAIEECRGRISGETAPVVIEPAADLPVIEADPERLKQVLMHVLSNALKFTPPEGRITICARAQGSGLDIVIADTGIGMAPEMIEVALEPFRQIDSSLARKFEGTGLGLPLSKALMELHGGSIAIESRQGAGTKVTLSLPGPAAGRMAHAA